jgi:16S rRNA C967 or C1407 C5-methylase (RsmB/RsmF family)/NOL1/NOP2/fmu family ribosome biogenesis protein
MLPAQFISRIKKQFGQQADVFLASLDLPSKTSIRFHTHKLVNQQFEGTVVPWYERGLVLHQRPSFILDPLWHAGAYYVQESSSMYVAAILRQIKSTFNKPIKVLDLSAAPGGKSTLILDILDNNDLLVCNEPIKSRASILVENMIRWGYSNVAVTRNQVNEWADLEGFFDVVLIDAPCSGEGMFRKDHRARQQWSEANVELCASRQASILQYASKLVNKDGYLIYSTCTFNEQENEERVLQLHQIGFESMPLPMFDGVDMITSYKQHPVFAARFLPHRTSGEGFFISLLKQHNTPQLCKIKPANLNVIKPSSINTSFIASDADQFTYIQLSKGIIAFPTQHIQSLHALQGKDILHTGLQYGEMIQQKLIPNHGLALSVHLNKDVERTNLDIQQALLYLKKGNLPRELFAENGWQVVTYQHLPFGWVNVLSNRVNNYLPTQLRILKDLE